MYNEVAPMRYCLNLMQGQASQIYQLISPKSLIYASANRVSIGSDSGLSPVWHRAII